MIANERKGEKKEEKKKSQNGGKIIENGKAAQCLLPWVKNPPYFNQLLSFSISHGYIGVSGELRDKVLKQDGDIGDGNVGVHVEDPVVVRQMLPNGRHPAEQWSICAVVGTFSGLVMEGWAKLT
jgi:hypothetical protein